MAAGDEQVPNALIHLVSSDNRCFAVPVQIARMSDLIGTMLDGASNGTDENVRIPLPEVKGDTLERVIEWCTQHKDDPEADEDDEICDWDKTFLDSIDKQDLYDLVSASYYLIVKGLFCVAWKTTVSPIQIGLPVTSDDEPIPVEEHEDQHH